MLSTVGMPGLGKKNFGQAPSNCGMVTRVCKAYIRVNHKFLGQKYPWIVVRLYWACQLLRWHLGLLVAVQYDYCGRICVLCNKTDLEFL
ncbi:hypothetical protein MTR67_016077 [Solanum verrucosum]|uniref:Uncharacterized protein n=1 Tax=Solanum verrucosum TaxID=315347 RepID=A0AAF0QF83_SOLVR|nr:hypothetical protein MTR67_016077 [Solanum verrucosum]